MTKDVKDIYPDFVQMAAGFGVPAKRVVHPTVSGGARDPPCACWLQAAGLVGWGLAG